VSLERNIKHAKTHCETFGHFVRISNTEHWT